MEQDSAASGAHPNIHPGLYEVLETAGPLETVRTIVQFQDQSAMATGLIQALGAEVHYKMQTIPALFVSGTPETIRAVAALQGVRLVEYDHPIEFDLNSAVFTGRAHDLWGAPNPQITLPDGTRVDGAGIGVAVVDTGVYAMHRDLQVGKVTARNLLAMGAPVTDGDDPSVSLGPIEWVDSPHSEGPIGHGTHVAGIVAGSGELSGGKYRGSAPGASLYGFGHPLFIGAGPGQYTTSIWYAVSAWDWIYQHGHEQDPPIRVITNSWGYSHGSCDVDLTISQVQKRLIMDRDIVMTFSVGNSGGDGSEARGRNQFQCPWEGHIGVASIDDGGIRDREGGLSSFSARGDREDPNTWPHIAGPGSNITAANGMTGPALCNVQPELGLDTSECYISFSGTSMSTPFVAGVVALVLQARPDLRPADVQYILQTTAYKFGEGTILDEEEVVYHSDPDGDYRYHGRHYAHGHGLVDAEAAVKFALGYDPAEHPVVYGVDETPEPIWNYTLGQDTARADEELSEESPMPALVILLVALVATAGLYRRRH
jgi:serine protease AprX